VFWIRVALHSDSFGRAGLRAAIARHVGLSRGVRAEPADVVVTNGIQQALDLVGRVLLEPGIRVAVEDPGYPPVRLLFASLGARVVPVPVDAEGLVVDALPDDVRLVYVSPSHQFPLSMSMSLRRRLAASCCSTTHIGFGEGATWCSGANPDTDGGGDRLPPSARALRKTADHRLVPRKSVLLSGASSVQVEYR
jgi:hypothetical protein